jgi:hypothetical protein
VVAEAGRDDHHNPHIVVRADGRKCLDWIVVSEVLLGVGELVPVVRGMGPVLHGQLGDRYSNLPPRSISSRLDFHEVRIDLLPRTASRLLLALYEGAVDILRKLALAPVRWVLAAHPVHERKYLDPIVVEGHGMAMHHRSTEDHPRKENPC